MRTLLSIVVFIFTMMVYSQKTEIKKPDYVIIINDTLSSKKVLEELGAKGYIKSMNKGANETQYQDLLKKFGDKIGDKEFIITVELLSEKEKAEQNKSVVPKANSNVSKKPQSQDKSR